MGEPDRQGRKEEGGPDEVYGLARWYAADLSLVHKVSGRLADVVRVGIDLLVQEQSIGELTGRAIQQEPPSEDNSVDQRRELKDDQRLIAG